MTLYILSLTFFKFSQLALYLRFFKSNSATLALIYIAFAIISISNLSVIVLLIFVRTPLQQQWFVHVSGRINPNRIHISLNAINLFIDVFVALIPVWPVQNLQMGKLLKANVLLRFATGLLCCTLTIVRLILIGGMRRALLAYYFRKNG